jgi:hypothetical protein
MDIGRTVVHDQLGQKFTMTFRQSINQYWWWVPVIAASCETVSRRVTDRSQPRKKIVKNS